MKDFKPAAWVLPQPVAIIGTYNDDGTPNAMNAAWVGQWEMNKVMVAMGSHLTTKNLNRNGVFTMAFATQETRVASDYVGIASGAKTLDKMARAGFTAEKATKIDAPVFTDFPLTLECRIVEKYDESEEGYYIVAEIVNIRAREDVIGVDGKPDMAKMNLIVFNPIQHTYHAVGEKVGNAFSDGNALK